MLLGTTDTQTRTQNRNDQLDFFFSAVAFLPKNSRKRTFLTFSYKLKIYALE